MAPLAFPTLSIEERLGDYQVLEPLESGVYGARTESGERVVLSALTSGEASAASSLPSTPREHLVACRGTVEGSGALWFVTEDLRGETLGEQVARTKDSAGSFDSTENVRTLLRIADVVAHLHEAGGWHGRLHPNGILLSASARLDETIDTPILLFRAAASPPYRSPERAADAAGSPDDDTWALGALAFELLTGRSCPEAGFTSEEELAEQGVIEEPLRAALFSALGASASARRDALRPLRRALARHFVHRADDASLPAGVHSSTPPPLPGPATSAPPPDAAAHTPSVAASPAAEAKRDEKRRAPALVVGGLVVGLGVAWAARALLQNESAPPASDTPPPATAAQQGSAKDTAISINDVAVTGDQEVATGNELATCVAGYLPHGDFETERDLAWVCSEMDAARGSSQLLQSGRAGSQAVGSLKAMGPLAQVVFAAVQKGCCEGPAQLTTSDARCAALGPALAAAGKAVVDGEALESALANATEQLSCGGSPAPSAAEQKTFQGYVDAIRRE